MNETFTGYDRTERQQLENTIWHLRYCADNIFQDEFHTVIEKLIKKAKRRYRLEPPLGNWVNKREDLK